MMMDPHFIWIKSYLHVDTNVDISCLNWNNLGIITCIRILAVKSNSKRMQSLWTKFQPPKDERQHSFLVTWPNVKKQLSLVPNILLPKSKSHQTLISNKSRRELSENGYFYTLLSFICEMELFE